MEREAIMSTTAELQKYIGKTASHKTGFYRVNVKIQDMRVMYGADQAQITPISGEGLAWVRLDSLQGIQEGA